MTVGPQPGWELGYTIAETSVLVTRTISSTVVIPLRTLALPSRAQANSRSPPLFVMSPSRPLNGALTFNQTMSCRCAWRFGALAQIAEKIGELGGG